MRLEIESEFWREGNQYVGRANPFNVVTCGTTGEEAEKALHEAVKLFLETASEMGTLEDILAECGYLAIGGTWTVVAKPERRAMQVEIAGCGG
jgi:predicted RNase H-like HicB family nuclease